MTAPLQCHFRCQSLLLCLYLDQVPSGDMTRQFQMHVHLLLISKGSYCKLRTLKPASCSYRSVIRLHQHRATHRHPAQQRTSIS